MGTVKSGTLLKQVPSFLTKEWKPKHCVLYNDGEFSIYQNATDATAEIRINLRTDVRAIEAGRDCGTSIKLPNNRNDIDSLFAIFGNEKKPHYFLTSGQSESREWVVALDRIMNQTPSGKASMAPLDEPPPYSSRLDFAQNVRADPPPTSSTNSGIRVSSNPSSGQHQQQQPMMYPPQQGMMGYAPYQQPPPMYGYPPQQPMYPGGGYGPQPMAYGPPMYGQPMYIQQAPQPQQQQSSGRSNTGSLLMAGGGGLLGGYLLGSTLSEMSHHHGGGGGHHDHGGGYDGGGGFDGGGFDF